MNPLFEAALDLQQFCHDHQWRFCVIGGLAVQRWGEPRLTRDVDCTILTGFGRERAVIDPLLERYTGRVDDPRAFALSYRVVLVSSASGVPLDVSLGAMPFEERAVARASPWLITAGASITTCSAEDLIVFKAFAGRDRDWVDIDGIVARQATKLDARLVFDELIPLVALKADATTVPRLERLFRTVR